MTKLEFLKELESLLPDIPLEERNEALQYYNGYFDDAGEDQEQEIIKELGSPERVASIIKADLNPMENNRESRGYFTEKGYQETISNEYEIVGSTQLQETENNKKSENEANTDYRNNKYAGSGYSSNSNSGNAYSNQNNSNGAYSNSYYSNTSNNTSNNTSSNTSGYANGQSNTKKSNTGLIVLIAILTSPFWLPIFLSAISVVIGLIAAVLGITFGFGVGGVTMICAGIVLFIAGLIQISAPFTGLVMIGGGLIVLGVGMLLVIACVSICKYVLPTMVRGLVNLCRLPFKNRSVMA